MRQDQYVIKSSYRPLTYCLNLIRSMTTLDLTDKLKINEQGNLVNEGLISLFNPTHVSMLLRHYSLLKESSWDKLQSDLFYMMKDLDNAVDRALKDKYPIYFDVLVCKIDGIHRKSDLSCPIYTASFRFCDNSSNSFSACATQSRFRCTILLNAAIASSRVV